MSAFAGATGDSAERVLAMVDLVNRRLAADEARRAAATGLSLALLAVLEPLATAVALPAGELGRRAGLAPSALSHALSRLERDGLIARERQRGDGRVVVVRLTRQGRSRLAPARNAAARRLDLLGSSFPAAVLDRLSDRLEQLAAVLSGSGMPPRAAG